MPGCTWPIAPSERLLCWLHGGPTDQWQVTFMPRVAYWRAQGWNVLVPDHRGSTGHGRAYQQALRGRWGELDVSDIVDVLAHAHAHGWGSRQRTAIVGSSAGGFTALGVAAVESAPARRGDRCLPRHGSLGIRGRQPSFRAALHRFTRGGSCRRRRVCGATDHRSTIAAQLSAYPDPVAARRHRPGGPDRPEPGVRRAMSRGRRRHRIRRLRGRGPRLSETRRTSSTSTGGCTTSSPAGFLGDSVNCVTDDWNPNDPDATRVHYDLANWSFEQMAELAATLADAEIPHAWDGDELVVPESAEEATDDVVAQVEMRLGIAGDPEGTAARTDSACRRRRVHRVRPRRVGEGRTGAGHLASRLPRACRSAGRTRSCSSAPTTRSSSTRSSMMSRTTKASTFPTRTKTTPISFRSRR